MDASATNGFIMSNSTARQEKPAHPAALLLPPMTEEEFNGLVEDIRVRGLLEPIELFTGPGTDHVGSILDGVHREWACIHAGVEPKYRGVTTDDPVGYALARNTRRRHLNRKQRRRLIAKLLALDPTRSDRQIAKAVGGGHLLVGQVRQEQEANRLLKPVEETRGADGRTRRRKKAKDAVDHTLFIGMPKRKGKIANRAARSAKRSSARARRAAAVLASMPATATPTPVNTTPIKTTTTSDVKRITSVAYEVQTPTPEAQTVRIAAAPNPRDPTPQEVRNIAARAERDAKRSEQGKQKTAQAGIGADSAGELARLQTLVEELTNHKQRLERENAGLRREIEMLKSALAQVKGKQIEGEDIPASLRRKH